MKLHQPKEPLGRSSRHSAGEQPSLAGGRHNAPTARPKHVRSDSAQDVLGASEGHKKRRASDPVVRPATPWVDVPSRPPSAQQTRSPALQTTTPREPPATPQVALNGLFYNGRKTQKIRLDGPQLRSLLGERAAQQVIEQWRPMWQKVDGPNGYEMFDSRPFRASVITGNASAPPMLMGPTRAHGTYGKIRDCFMLYDNGYTPQHFVLKELRTTPVRPRLDETGQDVKARTPSRLNRKRTYVMHPRLIDEEERMAVELGGCLPCLGRREANGKVYLILTPADSDLFEVYEHVEKNELSALARHVGERYAQHLTVIHSKNCVHVDGKLENVAMVYDDGSLALTDFGGTMHLDKKTQLTDRLAHSVTYRSPELARGEKFGRGQDVWCMGITLLMLLDCPDALVELRAIEHREHNRRTIAEFSAFRASLLSGRRSAGNIDIAKLKQAQSSVYYARLKPAIDIDAELTAYILGHLLDPNPKSRHTAVQAEVVLRRLGEPSFVNEQMQNKILPRLIAETDYIVEGPAQLTTTLKAILAADPDAFVRPAALQKQAERA